MKEQQAEDKKISVDTDQLLSEIEQLKTVNLLNFQTRLEGGILKRTFSQGLRRKTLATTKKRENL